MSKHTPAPWVFVERERMEDGSIYPEHILGGVTQLQICLMESPGVAELCVNNPVWRSVGKSEMSKANARLIAAAPELLEACRAMIEWDDREKDHAVDFDARMQLCRIAFDKARAAIEKAEGRAEA